MKACWDASAVKVQINRNLVASFSDVEDIVNKPSSNYMRS